MQLPNTTRRSPSGAFPAREAFLCGLVAWGLCLCVGGVVLVRYSLASNRSGDQPTHWPVDSKLEQIECEPRLLLFLHPKCGCSLATLTEFTRALRRSEESVAVKAVFYCPPKTSTAWVHGELWEAASQIPGCQCTIDVGGRECKTFGVSSSGHVLLFDERGDRVFSGGVTSSRGHEGDNLGGQLLAELIGGRSSEAVELPVFGCQIVSFGSTDNGTGEVHFD